MKLKISDLKTDRQWRAATGFSRDLFFKLLNEFEAAYLLVFGVKLQVRLVGESDNYCIADEQELLLFTLFSLKAGLTYDLLGLCCGMNGSNAKRNQETGLLVLEKALVTSNVFPKRNFLNVK